MIEEALRQCGKSGEASDDPTMLQAIPENSAVGASASNGRAERAVQTFEDLCRTYKSTLETRINATVLCNLPVFRWLVEHVASNLNRYSVNPDGRTPYEDRHGKKAVHRLVEFGERVFYDVPRRLRSKLDNRWRLGTFLGVTSNSNDNYIGTSDGTVTKPTSVVRVVSASRWNSGGVLGVVGIPGRHNPNGKEEIDPSVEEYVDPHLHADDAARATADEIAEPKDPKVRITQRDYSVYGFTPECPRCTDLENARVKT